MCRKEDIGQIGVPPGSKNMFKGFALRFARQTGRWCMIAIAIIGYFCAFPELAVLLGIFVAALLVVSPVFVVPYLAHRSWLRSHRPADPRP
jgi:hypothetical protein